MIHATLRAIAYLRGEPDDIRKSNLRACDLASTVMREVTVLDAAVGNMLPTCPACLVLWDAALESGTPPAPRPAHGPTDG